MAYSYGKPVITSDIPAFREETQNGKTGILTDGEDPEKAERGYFTGCGLVQGSLSGLSERNRETHRGKVQLEELCKSSVGGVQEKMNNQKQETSMKRAIMMNMFWALFSLLINTLMNFLITPYVTNNIGVEAYGFVAPLQIPLSAMWM